MRKARVGFLGVGWIGRHRMAAMLEAGCIEAAAIADPDPEARAAAASLAPEAVLLEDLAALLACDLDGVVIATPSAAHAAQAQLALAQGCAVFCQKPLSRTAQEARAVLEAARAADRLLMVDFSYRGLASARAIRERVTEGALGRVFAVDLAFHNAYGPDKPWFSDPSLAGGGCLIDLGTHLVDLALWTLGFPAIASARGRTFAQGAPATLDVGVVEDFATGELILTDGAIVRLACSWRAHAGQDAVISAVFHGEAGGAALTNVDGSFYEFEAASSRGVTRKTLTAGPDPWGGRLAAEWAQRLAAGAAFDPAAEHAVAVAEIIDQLYGR